MIGMPMTMIQMMIRMMGMPIVTVPNGGHTDSLVIHQPALTVPLSGLVIIFNIWQKWPNWQKCIIFNIWQQFQLKMAKWPNMLSEFHSGQLIIFKIWQRYPFGVNFVTIGTDGLKLVQAATGSSYRPIKRAFLVLRRAKIATKKKWLEWPNLARGGQIVQNGQ